MARGLQGTYQGRVTPERNPSGAVQAEIDRRVGELLDRALRDTNRRIQELERQVAGGQTAQSSAQSEPGAVIVQNGSIKEIFIEAGFPAVNAEALLLRTDQYPGQVDLLELWVNED